MVRHQGCVNRVRSFNFGNEKVLAANWSEKGAVHIWDLAEQLKATQDRHAMSHFVGQVQKQIKPVYTFEGFTNEGYALDWSSVKPGHLLTGDNSRNIHLFKVFLNNFWNNKKLIILKSHWTTPPGQSSNDRTVGIKRRLKIFNGRQVKPVSLRHARLIRAFEFGIFERRLIRRV